MDECPELLLKKLCCTCLSQDRKLMQLCRLTDGINNLYLLLSYDSEAYREGFYKDTAHWFICWECWAVMARINRFRRQACAAQRKLSDIVDGRTDLKLLDICLSRLSRAHKSTYDQTIEFKFGCENVDTTDNFIDCGPVIKSESDEDVPLSELHNNDLADDCKFSDDDTTCPEIVKEKSQDIQPVYKKRKKGNTKRKKKEKNLMKNAPNDDGIKDHFTETQVSDEMWEKKKMAAEYVEAKFKCESCVEGFKNQIDLDQHVVKFHTEGAKTLGPVPKPRRNRATMDKRTAFGYKCAECDMYFDNKNLRWKHVQRAHREGHPCSHCGKRFAFRHNLARHELGHKGPPPREECPQCHKQVRSDLAKAHMRTHARRQRYACAECDKRFVSKASYEHHLKYTARHAQRTPNKYKCSMCDKRYRSRGELRDHANYQHMNKTQHKCPVCGKALATPRCVTRHVRRAHLGVKEQPRDKVCQQCGKAFRDKKTLREHEFIHTGERPLSCEVCGCTFRQSASLYTHRRRVHKIHPPRRRLELVQAD